MATTYSAAQPASTQYQYSSMPGQQSPTQLGPTTTPRGTVRVPLQMGCASPNFSPRRQPWDTAGSGGYGAPGQQPPPSDGRVVYPTPQPQPPPSQQVPSAPMMNNQVMLQQCASEPLPQMRSDMTHQEIVTELQALKVKQGREFSYLMQEQKRREQVESYLRVEVERLRADYKNVLEQLSNECSMRDRERMQFMKELESLRESVGSGNSGVPIGAIGGRRGSMTMELPSPLPVQATPMPMSLDMGAGDDARVAAFEKSLEQLKSRFEGVNMQQQRRTEELADRLERLLGMGAPSSNAGVNILGPNNSNVGVFGTRSDSPMAMRMAAQQQVGNQSGMSSMTPESPGIRDRGDSKPPSEVGATRMRSASKQERPVADKRPSKGVSSDLERRVKEVESRGNVTANVQNGQIQFVQEFEFLPGNQDTPQAGFMNMEMVKPILDDIAELALIFGDNLLVEGHCRKKGTEFWQTLADNRARLVAEELMMRGVPQDNMQIKGTPGKHGKANRHMTMVFSRR